MLISACMLKIHVVIPVKSLNPLIANSQRYKKLKVPSFDEGGSHAAMY